MKHRYPDIFKPATKEQRARRPRVKGHDVYGYGLPVIAAVLPNLILNKVAMERQSIDRSLGQIFYLDFCEKPVPDSNLNILKDLWKRRTR